MHNVYRNETHNYQLGEKFVRKGLHGNSLYISLYNRNSIIVMNIIASAPPNKDGNCISKQIEH